MTNFPLSPLDGRYAEKVKELAPLFSEFGLMRARTQVEIQWLFFLSEKGFAPKIQKEDAIVLQKIKNDFSEEDYQKIKSIENTTNHDVKAVEYFLRDFLPANLWAWIHFACTSEDINNTAYGLILKEGREILLKNNKIILENLKTKSLDWKQIPLLCKTHGQTATPSTMGKELAVFYYRLQEITTYMQKLKLTAKINGATGNFAAHYAAFPEQDWISLSQEFIETKLKLDFNPLTTQIESHDQQAALLNEMTRLSSVYIDLCRDIWGYISLGYFGQKIVAGEIGSSTMPHKVNPIDFENAEGNFKLARGIARTLADELPISRWQRDLTDSTLQRNLGLVFGHFQLGLASLTKGLGKIELRADCLDKDLTQAPEVLTEAIQTVLRKNGHHDAYEQLKSFSRGKKLNAEQVQKFIKSLDIEKNDQERLLQLTAQTYIGLSSELVDRFVK